jgi:hypothetical protein
MFVLMQYNSSSKNLVINIVNKLQTEVLANLNLFLIQWHFDFGGTGGGKSQGFSLDSCLSD